MVFHWSLSDCKSPPVSRTLLSILADLKNAVVCMVSTRPLISKFSSPCTNPLVTVPWTTITIGIIVSFLFQGFFSSLARSRYFPIFRILSILLCVPPGQQSPQSCKFSLFCWLSLGLIVWLRLGDPFVSQNLRGVCVCHSPGEILECVYTWYLQ